MTIDLSPTIGSCWGDCARSFVIENGEVTRNPQDSEFLSGQNFERMLHEVFVNLAEPERTFEEVFLVINNEIQKAGYENLDFLGNIGHSIVKDKSERIYFEKGNTRRLKEVEYFTFEPHIRIKNGKWGYKHENIYYFDKTGRIQEL